MPPRASVIVDTFNHESYIKACLKSLLEQERVTPEVIVVDVGSTDKTVDLVKTGFPKVRLVKTENRGFGAGNNVGVQHARTSIVAFANPDTVASSMWLATLCSAVKPGKTVATTPALLMKRPTHVNTIGLALHMTGHGLMRFYDQPLARIRRTDFAPGVSGVGFAMDREDYLRLGGFEEAIFLYNDDTEFSWRLRKAGFRVRVEWNAHLLHDYRGSRGHGKLIHAERNRNVLLRKHLSRGQWIAYFPSLLVAWLLALVRLGPSLFFKALREARRVPVGKAWKGTLGVSRIAQRVLPSRPFIKGALGTVAFALPNLVFLVNAFWWIRRRER
ncbi:MAG TPA: glycosyltransferase family 2 protein [Candidatus Thermoplasmatota archaeon]